MPYFDHCATAPPNEEILSSYIDNMKQYWHNPASVYTEGVTAAKFIRDKRRELSSILATDEEAWLFTSGATESIVTAICGTLRQRGGRRSRTIAFEGDHDAAGSALKAIRHDDWPVTMLPLAEGGRPDTEALEKELQERAATGEDIRLITVLLVSNETGAVADVDAIKELRRCYAPDALLHLDMVQAPGRIALNFADLDPDLASFSGHKLGAPRGAGLLYIKPGITLKPLMRGGGQQGGRRGGTENAPLFAAMCDALISAVRSQERSIEHAAKLRALTLNELDRAGTDYRLNLQPETADIHVPAILSISFPGLRAETLLRLMEQEGFQLSAASACNSRADDSHVLVAMGLPPEQRQGTVRISYALSNTEEEAVRLGAALAKQAAWLSAVFS